MTQMMRDAVQSNVVAIRGYAAQYNMTAKEAFEDWLGEDDWPEKLIDDVALILGVTVE